MRVCPGEGDGPRLGRFCVTALVDRPGQVVVCGVPGLVQALN